MSDFLDLFRDGDRVRVEFPDADATEGAWILVDAQGAPLGTQPWQVQIVAERDAALAAVQRVRELAESLATDKGHAIGKDRAALLILEALDGSQ